MGFLTPNASGELDVLKTYALQQLAQMRTTVHGLSDEQANSTPTASDLSLVSLLMHAAEVAVFWSAGAASAPKEPELPADMQDHSLDELVADPRSLTAALDYFDRGVRYATENLDKVADLSAPVPVPEAPWYPDDLESWEARWCLLHLCTEIARHVGHADIIRETIDGKGSYELNDLAEAADAD